MPRITPADESNNPALAKVYTQITKTRGFVSDILKVFSHAPEGLERFAAFGEYVRYRTDLPARTREFAILAIARGNQYAWSHHYPHAVKAGLLQSELDALNDGHFADSLSAAEKAAARYAQEFANGGKVGDDTFAALKALYSERQITDLTLLAGYFLALGSTVSALRVELEAHFKPAMRPIA